MKGMVLLVLWLAMSSPAFAQTVTLQAIDGKFVANVVLNDRLTVRGLLDIGATQLTICAGWADVLGLPRGEEIVMRTVGERLLAYRTGVSRFRIGTIQLDEVAAVILSDDKCDGEALVGMSVLHRMRLTMEGDRLILRPGRIKRRGSNRK